MDYKEKIIELLFRGFTIQDISNYLKDNNYKTKSLSSVEKYISILKKENEAKTMFQLAVLLYKKEL